MPLSMTLPAPAASVKQAGPSIVLAKEIFPPLLVNVVSKRTLAALAWEILPPCVVIVPPILTGPVPFWVRAPPPFKVTVLAPVPVTRPLLVTVRGPPFVVLIEPLLTKLLPVRLIPMFVFVSKLPCKVAVPVQPSWVMELAVMA